MDKTLPPDMLARMLDYTDSVILKMSEADIMEWLDDEELWVIESYLNRYEKMEYYEVCCVLRDYINLYHK